MTIEAEIQGGTIKHPQVDDCIQRSWHMLEDCTLDANRVSGLKEPEEGEESEPASAEDVVIDGLLFDRCTTCGTSYPRALFGECPNGCTEQSAAKNNHPEYSPDTESNQTKSTNPKDILAREEQRVLLHLIPSPGLIHVALAMMDGARKYGPYNWRDEGVGAGTYASAAMRHIRDWLDGEEDAPDSGSHHLGHAAACLLILMDAQAVGNLVDDRPDPAPTSEMMESVKATGGV